MGTARDPGERASLRPPPPGRLLRVVVVDDEASHAELMIDQLRRAGFAPEWRLADTEAAYLAQLAQPPDLILSDRDLPEFSAARALELLRATGLDIPFIVIAATVDEEAAVALMRRGAADYLPADGLPRLGRAAGRALAARRRRERHRLVVEHLRASLAQYRGLFERVPVGLYRTTLTGEYVDVNPAFLAMLGYGDREALISGNAASLYVDPDVRREFVVRLERDRVVRDFDSQLRRADGTLIWVRANARIVPDETRGTLCVEGAIVDITEQKRAEWEIRRRAAHLETLNAIISSAASATEVSALLETTVSLTLGALACEMGGIWTATARHFRGLAPEFGAEIQKTAELAGRELHGPEAVQDWRAPAGAAADALASVMRRFGVRASVAAPIRAGGMVIGGISAASASPRVWLPDEMLLVEAIGAQIGGAVQRLQLLQVTQRRSAELEALYEIGRQLRGVHRVDDMYRILVEHAMRVLRAEHGALTVLRPEDGTFTRAYTSGLPEEVAGTTFPAAGAPSGQVVETGTAYVTADLSWEPRPYWSAGTPSYGSLGPLVVAPVRGERDVVGTIALGRVKRATVQPFTDDEVRLLEGMAEVGGSAIRRAMLHENLNEAYIQMVLSLARTVDARDSYTNSHSEQLAQSAEAVARELGCAEDEIQDLRWSALLHDIGKIGVPDSILRKPGPLTDEEWAVMRKHPEIGEAILRPVDRMRAVAKLVRHHQERWDGTGYPDRLRGEEIPLGARILAVADAYSAITDDRAYAKGRSPAHAVAELRRCAGTQFDARIVDVFCRLLAAGKIAAEAGQRVSPRAFDRAVPASGRAIARSLWEARRASRVVPAMVDVVQHLLRPLDLATVLDEVLSHIQRVFDYPICAVFCGGPGTQGFQLNAQRGCDSSHAETAVRIGGVAAWVAAHRRPYYAPDLERDPLFPRGATRARSAIAYPLIAGDQVIGVLDVESPEVDAFPPETRELLEAFAPLAALAILRAVRVEALHQPARAPLPIAPRPRRGRAG